MVVVLLLAVTIVLVRKHSHSKQTTGELYETPDAIGMKENVAYRANLRIAKDYSYAGAIPVADNVAYMPAAENIPAVQNKAYGSVSGAAVTTDMKEQVDVDEMYEDIW